jgi:hypothetical protein
MTHNKALVRPRPHNVERMVDAHETLHGVYETSIIPGDGRASLVSCRLSLGDLGISEFALQEPSRAELSL